ncbi:MAG: hypothetical protein HYY86_01615 [Candidatus Harrisonbacteria bacterium]|nr:hypothetical protein [Candidatus Harrisonbacteria bacterium]
MEKAYKVWGRVILALWFGMIIVGLFLVFIFPAFNVTTYDHLEPVFIIVSLLLMMGFMMRGLTLGGALSKKYNLPCRNVSVTVDDLSADSILYRQGLRSGDVVVAANGASLKSDTFPIQTWWQNKDSINLTVLRNGQEVQIVLRV